MELMANKVITFTGGLGAQIMSAAGYFYLKETGVTVSGYTGYFDTPPHLAEIGKNGDISHWSWELDQYGLSRQNFSWDESPDYEIIQDGPEKVRLAFLGLQVDAIQKKFPIVDSAREAIQQMFAGQSYACVHIRRGDYVNVASFMIKDDAYFLAIKRIARLVKNILIVSDSPITSDLMGMLGTLQFNVITAIGGSPHQALGMLRLSDILICSNSQVSYAAAALRGIDELTFFPARHDGDLNSYVNTHLQSIAEFQLLTRFT